MRDLLERLEAATPAGRDRGLDGLRALAVLGVVLGHWLVTALVTGGGTVRVASPLRELPQLAPLSWLFQTLAVFFLVGGWVAARGRGWRPDWPGCRGSAWPWPPAAPPSTTTNAGPPATDGGPPAMSPDPPGASPHPPQAGTSVAIRRPRGPTT